MVSFRESRYIIFMTPEQEIQELRALLARRDAQLADAQREAEDLRVRLAAAEEGAARLQRELAKLRKELSGPTSERLDPNRLPIPEPPPEPEETPEEPAGPSNDRPDPTKKDGQRGPYNWKNRTKNQRRDVSEMEELETIVHTANVTERHCACGCGAEAVTVGYDIRWRIERIPARMVRHKIVLEKVAFPDHGHLRGGTAPIVTAPSPVNYALPGALCGNQLLVEVASDKYCDHLPAPRAGHNPQRWTSLAWKISQLPETPPEPATHLREPWEAAVVERRLPRAA